MEKVLINDISLRDGAQEVGVCYTPLEQVHIAEKLAQLGVPIIEAGFPIASKSDAKAIREIAHILGNDIVICAMCRARKIDIEAAAESLGDAPKRRIQVVMGTSDIHLRYKFNISRGEAKDRAVEMVQYACKFSKDVEFAAEDATRSDWDYLLEVSKACIEAGATTIEFPDTVGYSTPQEYFMLIKKARTEFPENIIISAHCHDDLGLAVANTLAGAMAGAQQLEVTMNGLGERAGNAELEEVVMALKVRQDIYKKDVSDIKTEYLNSVSELIENFSQARKAPNKAIVGQNAFLHESGIHQDGMLKNANTYQLINPRDVGVPESKLVLGKLSGKSAILEKLKSFNVYYTEEKFKKFYDFFIECAEKKKFITDVDIQVIMEKFEKTKV